MKNSEELERLIKLSYNGDNIFAINTPDIESAQNAIVAANQKDIGFEDYLNHHKEYLESKGCSSQDITKELNKVKEVKSYFKND